MVRQEFDAHRLPDDFAGKLIEGVPVLAWERTGNTTYIAAVSAAFAPSDRPFDYDSLMVYSGLAFRLRYVRRKDGQGWSSVGPVGQFEEEVEAVCRATGCRQSWVRSGDVEEMKRRTIAAIDSGYCPTAYIQGDTGVIYGYETDGETILVRCYDLGEGFHRMAFEQMLALPGGKVGPFFMEPTGEPLPPRDALTQGLKMGLMNWRRGRKPGEDWQPWRPQGVWEYCFGDAAYHAWIQDLKSFDSLGVEEQAELYRVHSFAADVLYDARLAAGRFLEANSGLLGEAAREHLAEAAACYEKLGRSIETLRESKAAFCGRMGSEPPSASIWTPEARERETEVLAAAWELDAAAIAQIESALDAAE